jgi:shikimate dehydrogenase
MKTDPPKALAGLVGMGIQRSLTPAMQEAEARAHGLALHYQLIDLAAHTLNDATARMARVVQAAADIGFCGLNITYPFKQAVIGLLDDLSDEARRMGAVNTVVLRGGRLVGHNTDGSGWAWGFARALPDADLSCVVLLGAGGAGSAIAHAVLQRGAGELRIVDQDPARAQQLAATVQGVYGGQCLAVARIDDALAGATGLIHATPTGMDKLPGLPLASALLHPGLWVAEVVYFPLQTELLRAARAAGCRTVDGGTMAVGQAVGAFELFTGLQADALRMEAHFRTLVQAPRAPAAAAHA